jgi:RNA polymerase sigma-70 factor (ECF subfamily)
MASAFTITEYELMFRQHYKFLCLVAFRIVRDHDTAEDIVQDFFLNLWQRRSEIPSITSFQAYATRAVKNGSISFLRKQQTLSDEQLNAIPDGTDPLEEKEIFISSEAMTSRVMELVELLPAERKKIFLSYVVDRLSYAQIAEKNNISLNTVKTQMKRSYAFVRENLANDTLGLILLSIWLHGLTN